MLEVSPRATQTEITHAYRLRLRSYDPDTRSPLPSNGADERLRQIFAAYALLRDPTRRADYDRAAESSSNSHPYGRDQCIGTPVEASGL
jgi:DnaJ-class molecular chaperone